MGGLPPDMMGLGAPPAGGGGGDPMGALMGLLGGGGAAPPPEEGAGPSITDGAPGGGEEALITAIDAIQDAIDAEADQEDIQVMLTCQQKLQSILAKNQKEQDAAAGGTLSPGAIRKMAPAAGGGGGY